MKYRKQIYLGYDASGRQVRKWFYADTKAELNEAISKYKMELKKAPNTSDITFSDYSEHWFQTFKANLAQQSRNTIRTHLNKCSELDPFPIRKITRSMCQKVVNDSWEYPHAAKGVASVLRQIFLAAAEDGIISGNPADNLKRPKVKKAGFHLLTDAELDAVTKANLKDDDRLFVTILQVFGLRPGEALALMPADFDWKNKTLRITRALELPSKGQSRIKSTKTGHSREIPIPEALIAPLRKRIRGKSAFLLFQKTNGGLHTKTSYRRLSERIHKAVNEVIIEEKIKKLKKKTKSAEALIRSTDYFPDFTLYCFRHRRATDLYYLTQNGTISTKQAAELMGHSEIVFLNTYSHIDSSREDLSKIYDDLKVENL